jgi:hypothetical protein
MKDSVLLGFWRAIVGVPPAMWQGQIRNEAQQKRTSLDFMSTEHRTVHHFVVRELPRLGEPMSPAYIAERLHMSMARVSSILDDLEHHLTFLYRNDAGAVAWAYPVTTDPTPHRVTFSSGEQIHAA